MTDQSPALTPFLQSELERARLLARKATDILERIFPAEPPGDEGALRRVRDRWLGGHESASVGAAFALRRRADGTGDLLSPSIRTLGAVLAMGLQPEELFRQALGLDSSPDRGRAPSLHWSDFRRGILGPIRPPGTGLEVMAGITLAFRMAGADRVGLIFAGEGAPSTGAWHEGLNLATVRECPLVVLVDTPQGIPDTRLRSFLELCDGYGLQGVSVDAPGPAPVFRAVRAAVERARSGGGVQLVEYPTDRVVRPGEDEGDLQERSQSHRERVDPRERDVDQRLREALVRVRDTRLPEGAHAQAPILTDFEPRPFWYRSARGRRMSAPDPLPATDEIQPRTPPSNPGRRP